jgi:hypothetical protein
MAYYIQANSTHVTRNPPHPGKKVGRCATITGQNLRDEGKKTAAAQYFMIP